MTTTTKQQQQKQQQNEDNKSKTETIYQQTKSNKANSVTKKYILKNLSKKKKNKINTKINPLSTLRSTPTPILRNKNILIQKEKIFGFSKRDFRFGLNAA